MNATPRPHPAHVPTLTEVIEFDLQSERLTAASPPISQPEADPVVDVVPVVELPMAAPTPTPVPDPVGAPLARVEPDVSDAQLTQRILGDVQRQIDSMLEFRLRESMQPLLAQFTETLMQDLRDELSRTMRDVVTRAVTQEAAKLRQQR